MLIHLYTVSVKEAVQIKNRVSCIPKKQDRHCLHNKDYYVQNNK